MKTIGKGTNYQRIVTDFPRHAAARAAMLKNLKERCIVIQDFELAACLRDAQKRFETYANTFKKHQRKSAKSAVKGKVQS